MRESWARVSRLCWRSSGLRGSRRRCDRISMCRATSFAMPSWISASRASASLESDAGDGRACDGNLTCQLKHNAERNELQYPGTCHRWDSMRGPASTQQDSCEPRAALKPHRLLPRPLAATDRPLSQVAGWQTRTTDASAPPCPAPPSPSTGLLAADATSARFSRALAAARRPRTCPAGAAAPLRRPRCTRSRFPPRQRRAASGPRRDPRAAARPARHGRRGQRARTPGGSSLIKGSANRPLHAELHSCFNYRSLQYMFLSPFVL
jgi:hypothetical protein